MVWCPSDWTHGASLSSSWQTPPGVSAPPFCTVFFTLLALLMQSHLIWWVRQRIRRPEASLAMSFYAHIATSTKCLTRACCSEKGSVAEWLGEGGKKMEACDMKAPDLVHVRTVPYDLDCNWKVFNDNYLVSMPFISLSHTSAPAVEAPCLSGSCHWWPLCIQIPGIEEG